TDIRRGHVIMIDGQPCRVMDFTHRTPGNLRAFVQVRLRNLVTGNTFDTRLAATDFVDEAPLETKEFQVLYRDQGGVHVMDTTSYEQHTLDAEATGVDVEWLQPEMHIQVEWLNGRPVGIELPSVVELTVVQTSPVMRGATKTASTKPHGSRRSARNRHTWCSPRRGGSRPPGTRSCTWRSASPTCRRRRTSWRRACGRCVTGSRATRWPRACRSCARRSRARWLRAACAPGPTTSLSRRVRSRCCF